MRTAVLIAALALPARAQESSAVGRFEVRVHDETADTELTVYADQTPVRRLIESIARETGREVIGFEEATPTGPVSVYLEKRPLQSALHWILGSAGLRGQITAETIRVFDEVPAYPEPANYYDAAEAQWVRALRSYPDHEQAAEAEMALAGIQETRGAIAAAVNHYEYVIEKHLDSEYTPEAMLLSGMHLAELGEWEAAARRFEQLAKLQRSHRYQSLARLELARALCHSGEPARALYTLDALELHYPTMSDGEKRARLLVRGRALALRGEAIDALRALDLAARYSASKSGDVEILEVRALALERAERLNEASVAWMRVADVTSDKQREHALVNAARMALAAEDELGVLFIEAWADENGHGDAVRYFATQARMRIGLETESVLQLSDDQRLQRALELAQRGMNAQAVRALESLYRRRKQFTPERRLELVLGYARALDSEGLGDLALDALRGAVADLEHKEDRRRVYLLASELLERRGLIDDALEALQGRL